MKPGITILCLVLLFASCRKETPAYFQKKLAGTWIGIGTASYLPGEEWSVTFTFEENGHYAASVTSGNMTGVFDNGDDDLDHEEKKLVIHYVDSYGRAHGVIKYLHQDGQLLRRDVQDIEFSKKEERVSFRMTTDFITVYYTLERQ